MTLFGPIRSFKINNAQVTLQGKQNWPIGGCAILYTALSLYEIIKWHHTQRNSLYEQWKLGRTVTDTIGTAVSGFFVLCRVVQSMLCQSSCRCCYCKQELTFCKLSHGISILDPITCCCETEHSAACVSDVCAQTICNIWHVISEFIFEVISM